MLFYMTFYVYFQFNIVIYLSCFEKKNFQPSFLQPILVGNDGPFEIVVS